MRSQPFPHETSEEENELPGQKRAPYGSGWWGRGSPLMTSRKGCAVPLMDGGGLCSPRRWPIKQRILPNSRAVALSREVFWAGFLQSVPSFDRGCPRRELMQVACGHRKASPFPEAEVLRTRQDLQALFKSCGFSEGLRDRATSDRHSMLASSVSSRERLRIPTRTSPTSGLEVFGSVRGTGLCREHRRSLLGSADGDWAS